MEIVINKDLRKVETKDVGNFTFKQVGFLAVGIVCGGLSYFLQSSDGGEASTFLCVLPALPFILLGFLRLDGLSLWQYIQMVFPEKFLMPMSLKWESDFEFTNTTVSECFGDEYKNLEIAEPTEKTKKFSFGKKSKKKEKKI